MQIKVVVKPPSKIAGLETAEAILTLSFDLLVVFTLMTGSPFDLSITTVRSIPLLPSGKNTAICENMLTPSLPTSSSWADWGLLPLRQATDANHWSLWASPVFMTERKHY